MPQLDYITFKIQLIGTLIFFLSIFFLTIWIFLPFFFINIKLKFTLFSFFFQQKNKLKIFIKKIYVLLKKKKIYIIKKNF